jgi:hypothetical protein
MLGGRGCGWHWRGRSASFVVPDGHWVGERGADVIARHLTTGPLRDHRSAHERNFGPSELLVVEPMTGIEPAYSAWEAAGSCSRRTYGHGRVSTVLR